MSTPDLQPAPAASPWSPLRKRFFRNLFLAGVAANIGACVHDVGAGWLMTQLSPEPLMVALVQAAASFPLFALALPAGAIADLVDRRRVLVWTHAAMLLLAGALAGLAASGTVSVGTLLGFTLALGAAAALANPAWQTLLTDLVGRDDLAQATALNSVSLNLSRAVGPGLGGLVVAELGGPSAAFALRAGTLVLVVWALWRLRIPPRPAPAGPREHLFPALKAGLRYVRHSAPVQAVLIRTGSFVFPASALVALLPLIAREELHLGPRGYGLMMAAMGAGAVVAVTFLPRLRRSVGPNRLVAIGTLLYAGAMAAVACTDRAWIACPAMLPAGAAWVTLVVNLNAGVQIATPAWVRARALGCYLLVFFGCLAVGSPAWGWLAGRLAPSPGLGLSGIDQTLLAAAALQAACLGTLLTSRLSPGSPAESTGVDAWDEPVVSTPIDEDDGPVVVTVEYRIRPEDSEAFRAAMGPVSVTRYRDGATGWYLSRDTQDPTRWLEVFIVDSWAEHLRQHQRVTLADQKIQNDAKAFHTGPEKPIVRHFIAAEAAGSARPAAMPTDHAD